MYFFGKYPVLKKRKKQITVFEVVKHCNQKEDFKSGRLSAACSQQKIKENNYLLYSILKKPYPDTHFENRSPKIYLCQISLVWLLSQGIMILKTFKKHWFLHGFLKVQKIIKKHHEKLKNVAAGLSFFKLI